MSDVRVEPKGAATHLIFARPPLNVLTTASLVEFADAIRQASLRTDARALVLRGDGRGFSAGLDVKDHLPESVGPMLTAFRAALAAIQDSRLPVVASVHGPCLGGGMELAMAADLAYAADTATFGQPEIKLGVFPPFAAAAYPAWFGRARAAELVLLGETIPATEAFARGFLSGVVPEADLPAKTDDVCGKLAALSPSSLWMTRAALRLGWEQGVSSLDAVETMYRVELMRTGDAVEGLRSFLEKRSPRWRGR